MIRRKRLVRLALLSVLALLIEGPIDDHSADAQEMRRGTGSRQSGATARQSGSSSRAGSLRGRSSSSVSGRSSRSGPSLPSESRREDDRESEPSSTSPSSSPSDTDESEERDAAPTLGKACIYGARDEVLYRPKGSRCRGDAKPSPAKAPAREIKRVRRTAESKAGLRVHPQSAGPASPGFPPPRRKKAPRKTSAGCLYDKQGVVLFEPETSDCVAGIGAPKGARRSK